MGEDDAYIDENGVTDGGCSLGSAIRKTDSKNLCPNTDSFDMRRMNGGCNEQLSCKACMVSSSLYVGSKCFWCNRTNECMARSTTWFRSCDGGWQSSCSDVSAAHRDCADFSSGFPINI